MNLGKRISNVRAFLLDKLFIKQPKLRRWVTKIIYGTSNCEVTLFGSRLTINSLRENGYLRAFRSARGLSLWRDESSTLLALASVLRPGDTFVDVGANIGVFCCTISRLPGVNTMAFEANPDTFTRLAENARAHGVQAQCIAVSEKEETLEFCDGAVSHVFAEASHRNGYHSGSTVRVKALPLNELAAGLDNVFLKIDVEGHEPAVIRGASKLISAGAIQGVILDTSKEARSAADLLLAEGFLIFDPATFLPPTPTSSVFLVLSQQRARLLGIDTHGAASSAPSLSS